jgi:hypothetical protein
VSQDWKSAQRRTLVLFVVINITFIIMIILSVLLCEGTIKEIAPLMPSAKVGCIKRNDGTKMSREIPFLGEILQQ